MDIFFINKNAMSKYFVTSVFFIVTSFYLVAQRIDEQVISGGGNYGVNEAVNLSWTLGEVAINTQKQTEATLLQGFQQPIYMINVSVPDLEFLLEIDLYPNPTKGMISIELNSSMNELSAKVYDLFGRCLLYKTIEEQRSELDLSEFPPATYLLKILDQENERSSVWRVLKMK